MYQFWDKQEVKNYLVQNLFDVDEIVRKLGGCQNDEDYKIIRSYYYIEFIGGENPYEIHPSTKKEFEKNKDNEDSEFHYFSQLNYDDFLSNFWIDSFEDILYNRCEPIEQLDFISCVKDTFYELKFEGQAKLFLKNVIEGLNELNEKLKRLKSNNFKYNLNYKEINFIQEKVIELYMGSYLDTKKKIIKCFEFIYPEITNEFEPKKIKVNTKPTREELINELIDNNKNRTTFENYEKKLIEYNYLTQDYKWNKKPASIARFFLYCFNKKIFKIKFNHDYKVGLMLVRDLYDFYDGEHINYHNKIKKQLNKRNMSEFDFLGLN